jgi:hypothetical protein
METSFSGTGSNFSKPLGRPRHRWVDNVIGWGGVDLIDLAQDRDQWRVLVNTVMNFQVP